MQTGPYLEKIGNNRKRSWRYRKEIQERDTGDTGKESWRYRKEIIERVGSLKRQKGKGSKAQMEV